MPNFKVKFTDPYGEMLEDVIWADNQAEAIAMIQEDNDGCTVEEVEQV